METLAVAILSLVPTTNYSVFELQTRILFEKDEAKLVALLFGK